MSPRYAVYGLCALLAILAGLSGLDSCRKHRGTTNEHNAAVASGEANAHQHNAEAQDAAYAKLEAQILDRQKDVDRLNAERGALLRRLASLQGGGSHSTGDNPSPVEPVGPDDSALEAAEAVIAKDAEAIEALEAKSAVQDEKIAILTKRGDEWEATAKARERQAQAQEAATEAWKKAVKADRWKGRIEGFAAGAALGYVGGRR